MDKDFYNILRYTSLAPSGHNTQPWNFIPRNNSISIIPDYSRRLRVVDPDDHALFISLGCALENLIISARHFGYEPTVEYQFNDSEDAIKINLSPSARVKEELFNFIEVRQSTRNKYKPVEVDKDILAILEKSCISEDIDLMFFNEQPVITELSNFILEGNSRQFSSPDFKDELVGWTRFNKRSVKLKRDGLWSASMGIPGMPDFVGKMMMSVNTRSEEKRLKKLIKYSAGFVLFLASKNDKTNWVNLGRSYQRFGLIAEKYGLSHSHLNMPCEEVIVREKMRKHFGFKGYPLLLLRFGYSEKMPYSFRRFVEDLIIK